MYYGECTPAYAVEVIKEILDNAAGDMSALLIIRHFLDGVVSTDELPGLY